MRWVGIIILVLAVIGLVLGILAMVTPAPGSFQMGLAIVFLALGIALGGYTLFGLLTALGKMLPPG
jgi:predicted Kef-type K+ transport protein